MFGSSQKAAAPVEEAWDPTVPPFEQAIHLRIVEPTEENVAKINEFRDALANHKLASLYENHKAWADDTQLQRFLIARSYNLQKSLDMIIEALQWREKRKPSEIDKQEGWEEKMSRESETGKIYCPGQDRWSRPVLIFDNTVQNTPHVDDHMNFLAFNLEFAIKTMTPDVDKYLVFMHLENFSFFNMPPFASTRETIQMMCTCFPERLGHCIAYRPPGIFRTFFDTVKGFLDPRTVSKMIFITGDVSDGSENDKLLRKIIGDNWKVLTGAEQSRVDDKTSPGYIHHKYWPTVVERLEEVRSRSTSAKNSSLPVIPPSRQGIEEEDAAPPPPPSESPIASANTSSKVEGESERVAEEVANLSLEDHSA
ncbi:hypothetical protein EON65_47550 [archaeon]|nr:MAG: hypothetical protein EON65_47550 [archaeon]